MGLWCFLKVKILRHNSFDGCYAFLYGNFAIYCLICKKIYFRLRYGYATVTFRLRYGYVPVTLRLRNVCYNLSENKNFMENLNKEITDR